MEHISFNKDGVCLRASCLRVGADLVVVVSGGEQPHVGAATMAGPGEKHSINFAHHREQELTLPMAEALSEALGVKVLVAAGMHWQHFDADLLAKVQQAWRELTQMLIERLSSSSFNTLPQ